MLLFFGISIGFLLIILIFTRRINLFLKFGLLLLLVFLGVFSFMILIPGPPTRGPEDHWYEIAPWKHFILFVSMVLGMITNYLFEYVQARVKAKESDGQTQMPKFIWEKLVLPLIIAGMVFGYFWGQHGTEAMGFTVGFISYQNGYFWQTILEKVKS